VQGLRIRQRLHEQYKTPAASITQAGGPRGLARDKNIAKGEAIPDGVEEGEAEEDRQAILPPVSLLLLSIWQNTGLVAVFLQCGQ
jgi:hypothetical protein